MRGLGFEGAASPLRPRSVGSARALDQYYTRGDAAEQCVARLRSVLDRLSVTPSLWVEPSAGAGAFLDLFPLPRIGVDTDPRTAEAERCDFLTWDPPKIEGSVVVAGNPPFGKNASAAVRFFNRSARFAEIIALIVPRSFEKASIAARLDPRFAVEDELLLDPDSFLFEGTPKAVPCLFRIWKREERPIPRSETPKTHGDFVFTVPCDADFAFRRIGANAGKVLDDPSSRNPSSHLFLRDATADRSVRSVLTSIDWKPVKARSAGCPSIARSEIVALYSAAVASRMSSAAF